MLVNDEEISTETSYDETEIELQQSAIQCNTMQDETEIELQQLAMQCNTMQYVATWLNATEEEEDRLYRLQLESQASHFTDS